MKRAGRVWRVLGPLLKEQRRAKKRTQGEVAKPFQTNVPTMSQIEHGRRDLRVSEFMALCCVLGVPASALIGAVEADSKSK
jgi:transcriptional regulator with XRE-family HTH domain